jgi:hypothetical protein
VVLPLHGYPQSIRSFGSFSFSFGAEQEEDEGEESNERDMREERKKKRVKKVRRKLGY